MSVVKKWKAKRAAKAKAKTTGTPYVKYKRTKKGRPGENLMKLGAGLIGAGGIHAGAGKDTDKSILRGLAVAGAGVLSVYAGAAVQDAKRNQPTAKPVTKTKRGGKITKTRHVTPTGVTRTKTKKYKRR